jgi:hypothetical protein
MEAKKTAAVKIEDHVYSQVRKTDKKGTFNNPLLIQLMFNQLSGGWSSENGLVVKCDYSFLKNNIISAIGFISCLAYFLS